LHDLIGTAKSVTIGLNLDADLEPEAATIVEVNNFQFKGARSLLGRLLPNSSNGIPAPVGPLHHAGPKSLRRDSELYKDLQHLLETVAAPLEKALARYRDINVGPLVGLERELAFLTGAASLVVRLQEAGVAMCRPEIASKVERAFAVDGICNLGLALGMLADGTSMLDGRLVPNDARFDNETQILVITGPNRGGKTTYCRALGQVQVLFQAGLSVPGSSARLSPVDGIWTHFPLPEADRPGAGRLDEEVQRLRQIFGEATAASLILLNEPLTSTSERDALVIATDLIRALQMLGAHTVLVTHLHDLAHSIPELNESGPPTGRVLSLVAEAVDDGHHVHGTFHIRPGIPTGHSYAAEIARQHGLTFPQLRELLANRAARR
jgi:DNA mismatch repair ATPase MutS